MSPLSLSLYLLPLSACTCVWGVCVREGGGTGANWQRSLRAVRLGVYLRPAAAFSSISLSVIRCTLSCLPLSLSTTLSLPAALSFFHLQQSVSFKARAALSIAKKSSAEPEWENAKGKGKGHRQCEGEGVGELARVW